MPITSGVPRGSILGPLFWVLSQSESPWQRNDAITFFINLCVSLYQVCACVFVVVVVFFCEKQNYKRIKSILLKGHD